MQPPPTPNSAQHLKCRSRVKLIIFIFIGLHPQKLRMRPTRPLLLNWRLRRVRMRGNSADSRQAREQSDQRILKFYNFRVRFIILQPINGNKTINFVSL